jgi:hypothetical protein
MLRNTLELAAALSLVLRVAATPSPGAAVPAVAAPPSLPPPVSDPAGSDVFTTPRSTLLREKPSTSSRVLGRLAQGTRLALVETREPFLKVEGAGLPPGWIARGTAVVFGPDPAAARDLLAVGRAFARNDGALKLSAAILGRAAARLREAKTPDAEAEILAGEAAETAAAGGGPFPAELSIVEKTDASGTRATYGGAAFDRALALLAADSSRSASALRERATAGRLRARFPAVSTSFQALVEETAAWLELAETAEGPPILCDAAERGGAASLTLARFLLALGKSQDLGNLSERVRRAGARVQALARSSTEGRRLAARASLIAAMRGDGSLPFPQEARVVLGPKERVVRITGRLGQLRLAVETKAGATRDLQRRQAAIPLLPVPGSLRICPDGRSAAWIEVIGPAQLVPVMTSLEKDEPAREIAFLSGGRPLRDQALVHVVSTLAGFSRDGQRLGLTIEAWNETPGPSPRYSVVSVATGGLLFETSSDTKGFQRLLQ